MSGLSSSPFKELYIDPRVISKSSNFASIRVKDELRGEMFSSTSPHYKEEILPFFVNII